jgi:hydrogenase maturation factor
MCLGIPGQIMALTDGRRNLALVKVAAVERVIDVACIAADISGRGCRREELLIKEMELL